jgi:hypothetical protein
MTIRTTILLLLLAAMLTGCASTSGDLRGTWVLVERDGRTLETETPPSPVDTVKILNDDHFSFATQSGIGEIFGGGGTWTLDGDVYIETIRYHSHPELVGAEAVFQCRVEGDIWHHNGDFMAHGRHYVINETWRRVQDEGDR